MTNNLSLLSRFDVRHLSVDPFPHIVIEEALSSEIASQLLEEFPSDEIVQVSSDQNNQRWSYPTVKVLSNHQVTKLWKDFVSYHVSDQFWTELCRVFGVNLQVLLKKVENRKCLSPSRNIGTRFKDNFETHDLLLDAQISGNTPVQIPTSVRGVHLDAGDKIFSGLYYLRSADDDSTGGDLTLYRWKEWVPEKLKPKLYFEGLKDCVEPVKTVPYSQNTLVLMLDSFDALHAVSPRSQTRFTRKFLNLDGVLPSEEYRIPEPNIISRIRRRLSEAEK